MSDARPGAILISYTDGGARGNPGPAGIGVVLWIDLGIDRGNGQHFAHLENIKKYIGVGTNNFAEYTALIVALERGAQLGYKKIRCYLDSELVVKQVKGEYKIKEPTLKLLVAKVLALARHFDEISFTHVPRKKNADADKLVNEALDEREARV